MPISSVWRHLAAFVYDLFPIIGIWLMTSVVIVLLRGGEDVPPSGLWWFQGLLLAELLFYYLFSWKKGGQTLGMRAWKIGIQNYQSLTWLQTFWRFLAGLASTALLGMGLWFKLIHKQGWSWMDLACDKPTIDVAIKPEKSA